MKEIIETLASDDELRGPTQRIKGLKCFRVVYSDDEEPNDIPESIPNNPLAPPQQKRQKKGTKASY